MKRLKKDRQIFENMGEPTMIDQDKIKQAAALFLEGIGEDPNREGLLETPDRIARMCTELFAGLEESAEPHLSKRFTVEHNEIVLEKDIPFYSVCEHHLLPFFGHAHVAYIPNGQVVGLSKLARTAEVFARRPQIQEKLTGQIADAIESCLAPQGVMVIIEAEHLCMSMRGVQRPGTKTVTLATRGIFKDNDALQSRIFQMVKG
jgi:GTP cyclohydrolase I